jgi:FKBP-type peptidyl-prolyl cis-trans isomerase 2|tara:strand:- start:1156 stop:1581 length:426 start_codon:yes stop_codon:yes gene_type:complete
MTKVKNGDTVTVHYTGKFTDGTIFDSSTDEGREPIKTKLGEGNLIKGFENGLLEMSVGDKKTIEIEPVDAYGEHLDYMVQEVPKVQMPGEVEIGMHLEAHTDMGPIQLLVKEVKEDTVVLDGNHPLAGKKLIFDLEVIDFE